MQPSARGKLPMARVELMRVSEVTVVRGKYNKGAGRKKWKRKKTAQGRLNVFRGSGHACSP